MAPADQHDESPLDTAAELGPGYVVVARRYRPQTFEELVGQEHVARALSGAIAANRVGHAYLFTGARGVGKTSAARILAKALNCATGPTPTPCNRCDMCTSISAGSDVDVLEIDGASNRGIDEIRQLRQNVSIRPSRSRYKIYIIDEVHMLTREAFNALLKTLEEPPEHVKFIFCTTEATKIPVTILSRCQRFDFAGIGLSSIVERLRQIVEAEGVSAEPAALAILARRANGSMRDSQSLLEQLLALGGERISVADVHSLLGTAGDARLAELVNQLVEHDAAAAIRSLDAATAEGVDVGQLLEQLLGYLRDLLALAVGCAPEALLHVSADDHQQLAAVGKQLGAETILAMMQIVDHTLSRLRYSTQSRTLAEMALVRIAQLENLDELAGLVAGLRGEAPRTPSSLAPRPVAAPPASAVAPTKKKDPLNGRDGEPAKSAASPSPSAPPSPDSLPASAALSSGAPDVPELTPERVAGVWREALGALSGLLPDHAAACESVTAGENGRLVVTFGEKYTSCKDFCERAEQRAKLVEAVSQAAGRPLGIEFALAAARPAADRAANEPAASRAKPSEHPLVRRTGELFDARVVRVDEAVAK